MKKSYLLGCVSAVTLGGVIAWSIITTCEAATATLNLSGTVAATASITSTPTALASALTISAGIANQKVSTINELSNNLTGYTVTMSSANAVAASAAIATLVRTGGSGETPVYTLTYNAVPVVFVAGVTSVTPAGTITTSSGVNKDINITIVAGQVFTAGTYTDTLTLTLTNN